MPLTLPVPIQDKIAAMPETSYGANRVTLVLSDGRTIADVAVAWAKEVVAIGGNAVSAVGDLGFDLREVIDATR